VASQRLTGSSEDASIVRRRASTTLARNKCTNLVAKARAVTAVAIAELQPGPDVGIAIRPVKDGNGA
jgi:hypothetical protein